MHFLNAAIKRDTKDGKKIGGGRYFHYSTAYVEWLANNRFFATKKWLFLRGGMFAGMKQRVGKTRAKIGYWGNTKAEMLANVHHFGSPKRNINARPWFGWRQGYAERIEKNIFMPWIVMMARKEGLNIR